MGMDRWELPYIGRFTTKKFARKSPGVYFIRCSVTKRLFYIGMSRSCVYKAMYRHFQNWYDPKGVRVVYSDRGSYEVRVILLKRKLVIKTERRLIRYFCPQDNRDLYGGSKNTVDLPF